MKVSPVNFTYRSNIKQINSELIKAGYWIVEDDGAFFMYEKQRGKDVGKLHMIRNIRQEMFDSANRIVNTYLRSRGWIK